MNVRKFSENQYALRARIIPAVTTIVLPVFVFSHFYINPSIVNFYQGFRKFSLVSDIALSSALMFYLSQYARMVGKSIFEHWYFQGEMQMPTTEFLLYSNSEYSTDYKNKMRKKIKADFGLTLLHETEEVADTSLARKKIVEAISHVRKRSESNKFLLQHNIEYGAMRNTVGGSVIGCVIAIFDIAFFSVVYVNKTAEYISIVALIVYTLLILSSKWIISAYGRSYAKILIREYMTD
jgi:hypothetical protein